MNPEKIKQLIETGLPGANAVVQGDDGTHFEAVIVSDEFAGKTMLQQHQLVYKALGELMGKEIPVRRMRPCRSCRQHC